MEKAGFRFVGESTLLRNPAEGHNKFVFDKSIIGLTDQFIYKLLLGHIAIKALTVTPAPTLTGSAGSG